MPGFARRLPLLVVLAWIALAVPARAAGPGYRNPVFGAAAPDPFVLDDGGAHRDFWAFVTGDRFPVLRSRDLVHWAPQGTAFAARPGWVVPAGDWHPWAPSVSRLDVPCPGAAAGPCYVMYYVGLSGGLGLNCVAVAVAATPGGPYADLGPLAAAAGGAEPIGCGDAAGAGNIDPSPFVDPVTGQAYLYVSTNRRCAAGRCRRRPTLSAIPLTADRLHAAGPRIPLLGGGGVVEGPAVVRHRGTYYLFYSHGRYTRAYGMAYATAARPTGPFRRRTTILAQTRRVFSPGGGDVPLTGPHGGTWLVYHGRRGGYAAVRTLRVDRLSWRRARPDVPIIAGPSDRRLRVGP
jgi:beta-xylosidase